MEQIAVRFEPPVKAALSAIGLAKERETLRALLKEYPALLKVVEQRLRQAADDVLRRHPEFSQRIKRESKSLAAAEFARAPVVLYGDTTPEDVLRSWRYQLKGNLEAILLHLKARPSKLIEYQWMWWEDCKADRVEFLKYKKSVQILVDGTLVHAYVDAGVYGPVLKKGRFGIKAFGGRRSPMDVFYDNLAIYKLKDKR